jgi:hypothetical protein
MQIEMVSDECESIFSRYRGLLFKSLDNELTEMFSCHFIDAERSPNILSFGLSALKMLHNRGF